MSGFMMQDRMECVLFCGQAILSPVSRATAVDSVGVYSLKIRSVSFHLRIVLARVSSLLTCLARKFARERPILTSILVAHLLSIGNGRGRRELLESERADAHPGIQRDGHQPEIAELECCLAHPPGVEQTRGAVDDDADPAEARAAFQAPEDVVIQLQRFLGDGEREFARLKNERFAWRDDDGTHQILNRGAILEIDEGVAAVFEDAELAAQAEIDGAASELLGRQRGRDFDFSFLDVAPDVDIGEDHILRSIVGELPLRVRRIGDNTGMSASPQTRISPEQYLETERASESRSEYYNGYVYAMSGASLPHFVITSNITRALGNRLEKGPCLVGSTDMKIRVSSQGLYAYPDVMVICGEPKLAYRRNDILLNPTLIIEVLSPSTEAYDRGFKFHQYQLIESLQEYGLVSQTEARVEIFRRQANGEWLLAESLGLDAVCHFKSIACEITLAAIYLKVNFEAAPSAPITPDPNVPR